MDYHNFYSGQFYPLQDKFLNFFNPLNNGRFYLTGGTALSRFYFQHRYSEDLDFFSRGELPSFRQAGASIVDTARKQGFSIEVETLSDSFLRFFVTAEKLSLKIDFVNDMVFHWGELRDFSLFHNIDNEKNILANKLTCVSRYEAKDIVDIWIIARQLSFSWREIVDIADKKSPVDPVEVSRIIKTLPRDELNLIKWIPPDINTAEIHSELQTIAEDVLLGRNNSGFRVR